MLTSFVKGGCLTIMLWFATHLAYAQDYDPLTLIQNQIEVVSLVAHDGNRHHDIPLRLYFAEGATDAPVILFSHGLGGDNGSASYLGNHWAARGYVVVAMQHTLSDSSLLDGIPRKDWKSVLSKAVNKQSFFERINDVPAVIDQLETWDKDPSHQLFGRMRMSKIGMSGHSFGAMTTQALAGQLFLRKPRFQDMRIGAAIAMSPSGPKRGNVQKAFAKISIPWLSLTGTRDVIDIGGISLQDRLDVYKYMPSDNKKYQLVLNEAEHYAFNDNDQVVAGRTRNPNHFISIKAFTTAFWDAWLKGDEKAARWLKSSTNRSILESNDTWSSK